MMRLRWRRGWSCAAFAAGGVFVCCAHALQTQGQSAASGIAQPAEAVCPRPLPGAVVEPPHEMRSRAGVLELTLHLRTAFTARHEQRFCYMADDGGREYEAPTLRVHAGDELVIHFRNELTTGTAAQTAITRAAAAQAATRGQKQEAMLMPQGLPSADNAADAPCFAMGMSATSSNLHFHGLAVPPVCHEDEVLHTLVRAGGTFDYRVRIPPDTPPGLYWYHPHPHGYSEAQVLGGASGALLIDPAAGAGEAAGAAWQPEARLLILRDQLVTEAVQLRSGEAEPPVWDVSLNFVPVLYPKYLPAQLKVPTQREERWNVLNAAADAFVDLEYVVAGKVQRFAVMAWDGVALGAEPETEEHLLLAPGARVEVRVMTPAAGEAAELRTRKIDTGPEGEPEPERPIAQITAIDLPVNKSEMQIPPLRYGMTKGERYGMTNDVLRDGMTKGERYGMTNDELRDGTSDQALRDGTSYQAQLAAQHTVEQETKGPLYQRRLYFSEHALNDNKEAETQFFLTVEGQVQQAYRMGEPPQIVVHRGAVEAWTIENRARELHVFHIHQLHFRVVARDGRSVQESALLDTVIVPYWKGSGPYPSVSVQLDFSDRNVVGTFPYHCHILGHEDAGMMGTVEVLPEGFATQTVLRGDAAMPDAIAVAKVLSVVSSATPTGTVQFQQAGRVLAEVPLADFKAVFGGSAAYIAGQPLTAIYSGDEYFNASVDTLAARRTLATQTVSKPGRPAEK
jgi:FtsP/CotA-like multicopper oxidase with cupredoxin domain